MPKNKKTYLILADDSEEFAVALHYAAVSGRIKYANVAVLRVLAETEFQPWGGVEERMKAEQMEEAEAQMAAVADKVEAVHGDRPQILIEEGAKAEAVIRVLENDKVITKLILAGSTNPSGPGPLIEYFAGHGIEELNVPLVIVPGHLSEEQIEGLI